MVRSCRNYSTLLVLAIMMSAPCASGSEPARAATADDPVVVLLHGLGRTPRSMSKMAGALERAGYRVENIGYPSRDYRFDVLLQIVSEALQACCADHGGRMNFVTHSLGGIIVRAYAEKNGVENINRVVMLSPPNQGSELVDKLKDFAIFKWITGPTGLQLGTDPASIQSGLGPVHFELGVITGTSSFNPFYSKLIPGPDDGKVSVERTKVAGMTDFLVVPHTHSFIMNSDEVIRQTIYFFNHGQFEHNH